MSYYCEMSKPFCPGTVACGFSDGRPRRVWMRPRARNVRMYDERGQQTYTDLGGGGVSACSGIGQYNFPTRVSAVCVQGIILLLCMVFGSFHCVFGHSAEDNSRSLVLLVLLLLVLVIYSFKTNGLCRLVVKGRERNFTPETMT